MPAPAFSLRVVVADDSALMRRRVVELIDEEAGVRVVGDVALASKAAQRVEGGTVLADQDADA